MRFKENQLTPEAYKGAFLHFIDTLAPEVMDALKSLLPEYENLVGGMSSEQVKSIFDCIVTHEPEFISEVLFCFDENFRFCADENPELNENQKTLLTKLLDFRQNFLDFIKRFGLEKAWLKLHIFDTLTLQANNPHLHSKFTDRAYSWFIGKGGMFAFNFSDWYFCEIDSVDYAKEAMAAFKEYLDNYIKETVAQAKTHGYTTKGRPKELEQVEWLARWTVQGWTMSEIAAKYDTKKHKDAMKSYDRFERKVNAAFDRLEKLYDLPRRYKKHKDRNL